VNLIDSFNESFLSNTTKLYLKKKIYPNIGRSASYIVNFDNELFHPISGYSSIVSSNSFGYQDSTSSAIVKPIVDAYIDDDGNGKLRIYKLLNNQRIYLSKNAGTINYITGKLVLIDFAPQSVQESNTNTIDITVTPIQKDILSRRNQILLIDEENIQINCIPETVRTDPYKSSASSFPF
jgi:Tfp pilus tip-associated adhesin PilY1